MAAISTLKGLMAAALCRTCVKATLWSNLEVGSLEAAIDLEARTQILALATEDAKEQLLAFKEHRIPRYRNR